MEFHFLKIDNWEFIKGILNVWWFLAKEIWWVWLILVLFLLIEWGFKYLEKYIKNKRKNKN